MRFVVGSRVGLVEHARHEFVFPADVRALSPWSDPFVEDDRRELLEHEHPELAGAVDRDDHEVVVHGRVVNAALHLAIHQVVANQLWDNEPAQMWQTAQRLTALRYGRHDVLHMLMTVVGDYKVLKGEPGYNDDTLIARLDALPQSWHDLADTDIDVDSGPEALPPNREQRRAAKREGRRRH